MKSPLVDTGLKNYQSARCRPTQRDKMAPAEEKTIKRRNNSRISERSSRGANHVEPSKIAQEGSNKPDDLNDHVPRAPPPRDNFGSHPRPNK